MVCPANPPAAVCPTWTPTFPRHPYEMADALVDAHLFIKCIQERNALWQDSYAGCRDAY